MRSKLDMRVRLVIFALSTLITGALLIASSNASAQDGLNPDAVDPASLTQGAPSDDPNTPIWDGTYRRIRTPILMYHYISTPPEDADAVRRDLSVSPALFRAHLDTLFYSGYTPISLYDLNLALETGAELPAQPVILTFDDGYIDHFTNVYPLLREFGFTATFFIITGKADAGDPAHLSWAQISEMAAGGMDMEPHTKDHVELIGRDYDFLVYQVMGSTESLRAYIGRTPRMFAYPVGRYDANTLSMIDTSPLWRAVTTQMGAYHTSDNRLEMPRLRVSGELSVENLGALLRR